MNEQDRIKELLEYHILDTLPECEFDELAEIASAVCDVPISLITFIDRDRQWFKAVKGLSARETTRENAFCQHTLNNPKELLIVDDPLNDVRFRDNPMVQGEPRIRFYAGAPLETPFGNVLGTLCVIDNKPRTISEYQKRALKLLAKKTMDYLNTRRLIFSQEKKIESSAVLLKRLTDQAPGVIFQMERSSEGLVSFPFVSKRISKMVRGLSPQAAVINPFKIFDAIHEDDIQNVWSEIDSSFRELTLWNCEFRVPDVKSNKVYWYWVKAKPEKKEDGSVMWYGTFRNITTRKEYEQALEQILFDISHVMRRPVASMLGLTSLIEREGITEKELREYVKHIKTVSLELDGLIRKMNDIYSEKNDRIFDR